MLSTEHILLESDEREIPEARAPRKVHASLRVHSLLRRRSMALDIIDYYFLSVRTRRGRGPPSEYVLDLRFVEASPELSQHAAWRWMGATLGLAAAFAGSIWWIAASATAWWQHPWLPLCGALFAATGLAAIIAAYRTTETLALYSEHGQARVLECVGGLGAFRAVRRFAVKLAAHVQIAYATRRPQKAQHLRDEMREHFRLKEAGVLSEEEYDASKRRILSAHGGVG